MLVSVFIVYFIKNKIVYFFSLFLVVIKLEGGTDQDLKSLDGIGATATTTSEQEVKEIKKEENDSVKMEPKSNENEEESKVNNMFLFHMLDK